MNNIVVTCGDVIEIINKNNPDLKKITSSSVRKIIEYWITIVRDNKSVQIGYLPTVTTTIPVGLLNISEKWLRVHFEDVICDNCNKWGGFSACPDMGLYLGINIEIAWKEFDGIKILECPHCHKTLDIRQTIWFMPTGLTSR